MENVDLSQIDTTTMLGQIAVLLVALATVIAAVKPLLGNAKRTYRNRNYTAVAEDLKVSLRDLSYQKKIGTSMREWELTARETIRMMQNELIEVGAGDNPQVMRLLELLEENEKKRAQFIEEEISRDESE